MLHYHCYVEGVPTLEGYRLNYSPRDGLGLVFICPFVVLSDKKTGREMYNGMRGFQMNSKGTCSNLGFYKLDGKLDEQCPMIHSYKDMGVTEPYWVNETGNHVNYIGTTFRFGLGVDDFVWDDLQGRVKLTARRLGQICTFWVPQQAGLDYPQMLRSYMGKVEGTIDGVEVEGLFMLDFIYSRPDLMWHEMGMMTKLHNLWMNWLVEYEDGSHEGGYAWRGRPGSGFAAAHHFADNISTARTDAKIVTPLTGRGTVKEVEFSLGSDVQGTLKQLGSTDWPLHTCGTVSSINRDKKIRRSWNFTEFFPVNYQSVLDYQDTHNKLFGRYPSFQKLMKGARIVDQHLVF